MGGIVKREIEIGHKTCLLGFSGRDSVDSAVFDASTLEASGVNEVQTVTINGSPTGGTWTLSYKDQITTNLAFNATAAAVQAALRALGRIGSDGVTVTGAGGGPYTVTFEGRLSNQDVPLLVAADALTGGTTPDVTVAEATKGSSSYSGLFVLNSGLVLAKSADGKKVIPYTGDTNIDEVQTITVTGTPTGGTFALEFEGEQTANIAFNANAAAVQAALEALPNLDAGDVAASGGALPGTPVVITFGGDRGGQTVEILRAVNQALTGGTNPAVAVGQTTQGSEVQRIAGIFDGHREFSTNTSLGDKEIPVYNYNCVFDKDIVQDFDEHEDALRRWGRDNACVFKSQGNG